MTISPGHKGKVGKIDFFMPLFESVAWTQGVAVGCQHFWPSLQCFCGGVCIKALPLTTVARTSTACQSLCSTEMEGSILPWFGEGYIPFSELKMLQISKAAPDTLCNASILGSTLNMVVSVVSSGLWFGCGLSFLSRCCYLQILFPWCWEILQILISCSFLNLVLCALVQRC